MWLPGRFKRRITRRLRRGDWREAESLARRYIRAFPEDEAGWQALALAAQRGGDKDAVEKARREALAVAPTNWNRYNLARSLVREEKSQEATGILESLLSGEDPFANFLGHLGLAAMSAHAKDWTDARMHARAAEASMPNDRSRWSLELGSIVSEIPGEERWAERLLREGIAAKPNEAPGHVLLAVLIEDRDPIEAGALLQQARKHWPGNPTELDRYLPGLRRRQREAPE